MNTFLKICTLACLAGVIACTGGAAAKQNPAEAQTNAVPDTASAEDAENAADFTQVLGKEWKLAAVTKGGEDSGFSRDALGSDRSDYYTLRFTVEDQEADGTVKQVYRISGQAAPNRYFTNYQQNGSDVSFGTVAGTMMASFNELEALKEHDYYTYLQGVNRWALTGNQLELYGADPDGTVIVLRFDTE